MTLMYCFVLELSNFRYKFQILRNAGTKHFCDVKFKWVLLAPILNVHVLSKSRFDHRFKFDELINLHCHFCSRRSEWDSEIPNGSLIIWLFHLNLYLMNISLKLFAPQFIEMTIWILWTKFARIFTVEIGINPTKSNWIRLKINFREMIEKIVDEEQKSTKSIL